MKRIGIDCRLWNETGVGRYIRNLVVNLQKIDTTNEYVLFALSKDFKDIQFIIHNSKFIIQKCDIPWHTLSEQLEFPKILKKANLDLVHFPYFSMPIRYKGKFVVTMHDLILHHFPTGKASTHTLFFYNLKLLGYKYIISQAAIKAQKILTVSETTKQEIIDHLHVPAEKIVVTYEGIDAQLTRYNSQETNKTTSYFLYVGNAYPHKNLESLMDAFSLFLRHFEMPDQVRHDVKLILVGKGDFFYKRLEKKVKQAGLENNIVFKHAISDGELMSLYKNALALVMPSLMEGFGLPGLEAMENNCLVIASDIPIFHEIYKDVSLYFDPKDTHSLAEILLNVYNGKIQSLPARKKNGKELAKKFTWEKTARQTLAVYESCLSI